MALGSLTKFKRGYLQKLSDLKFELSIKWIEIGIQGFWYKGCMIFLLVVVFPKKNSIAIPFVLLEPNLLSQPHSFQEHLEGKRHTKKQTDSRTKQQRQGHAIASPRAKTTDASTMDIAML